MGQEEGFKFCLDIRNNKALPFHLACPERLTIQSSTNLPYYYYLTHLHTNLVNLQIFKENHRVQFFKYSRIGELPLLVFSKL
jgi:hypothetical protein